MDKFFKGSLAFCIISFSIIGLIYAFIALVSVLGAIIKPSDIYDLNRRLKTDRK